MTDAVRRWWATGLYDMGDSTVPPDRAGRRVVLAEDYADALERIDASEAARRDLEQQIEHLHRDLKTMEHKVITCGVAAHNSDPKLTLGYPDAWQSSQADDVRALRTAHDALKAEAEAIIAKGIALPIEPRPWASEESLATEIFHATVRAEMKMLGNLRNEVSNLAARVALSRPRKGE